MKIIQATLFLTMVIVLQWTVKADEQSTKLSEAINDFSLKLFKELAKTKDNLIYSGFSVTTALNMLLAGARTTTESEIRKALGYDTMSLSTKQSQDSYHQILTQQRNVSGYELNVANSMWIQSGLQILSEFNSTIRNLFYSEVDQVDFSTQWAAAENLINSWVNKETRGKIPKLFENTLNSNTRFVLVNAIYFKGKWVTQFKKESTEDYPFKYGDNTPNKNIPMMNVQSTFMYYEDDDLGAQILELPYDGKDVSMIIVLPKATNGLTSLESQLTSEKLNNAMKNLFFAKVVVKIPKFQSTSTLPLNDVLKTLGIKEAFTPGADLSGIDGKRDLAVSDAIQKALIEVNEEGTVAAAATGIHGARATSIQKPDIIYYFTADHPFLYLIRHKPTNVQLFMGRYNKP